MSLDASGSATNHTPPPSYEESQLLAWNQERNVRRRRSYLADGRGVELADNASVRSLESTTSDRENETSDQQRLDPDLSLRITVFDTTSAVVVDPFSGGRAVSSTNGTRSMQTTGRVRNRLWLQRLVEE